MQVGMQVRAVLQAGSRACSIVGGQWYKQQCGQQSKQAAEQAVLRAGRKQRG